MLKRFFSIATLLAGAIGAFLLGMAAWWLIDHDVWSISLDGDWFIPIQAIIGAVLVVGSFVAYTRRADNFAKVKSACLASVRAGVSMVWVCWIAFLTFFWIVFLVDSNRSDTLLSGNPFAPVLALMPLALLFFQKILHYQDTHTKKKETFYSDDMLDEK